MANNSWVKGALAMRGFMQRDLAQKWGGSEGSVSRWMSGQERQDLPIGRVIALAEMLGMSLDELAGQLGFRVELTAPSNAPLAISELPPLGEISMIATGGKMRVHLHLILDPDVAAELTK